MSTALPTPLPGDHGPHDAHLHPDGHAHHPPHLAHHFDTPMQQYKSAKLGMWVFLATEILMFGGLFCAYGVYRHNHPDVFDFAHRYLDRQLGALNTLILITSSLTMAWAVRAAQINAKRTLCLCLFLSILGGAGFMVVKSIEYEHKWKEHVFVGYLNQYNAEYKGPKEGLTGGEGLRPESQVAANMRATAGAPKPTTLPAVAAVRPFSYIDGNTGTADESKIKPNFITVAGLAPRMLADNTPHEIQESDLSEIDHQRINAFFSIYFLMTGLHGLHVLIGMSLIGWVLYRAMKNEFSEHYFTPVDLVGLYWHLVDLIWIFLFPLLYLIH
jgi:cytochrome c oxidase subunit 3